MFGSVWVGVAVLGGGVTLLHEKYPGYVQKYVAKTKTFHIRYVNPSSTGKRARKVDRINRDELLGILFYPPVDDTDEADPDENALVCDLAMDDDEEEETDEEEGEQEN